MMGKIWDDPNWLDSPMLFHDQHLDISRPFHTGGDGDIIISVQTDATGKVLLHIVKVD